MPDGNNDAITEPRVNLRRYAISTEAVATAVNIWRAVVLAAMVGIGGVLWQTVRDTQALLQSQNTANITITELKIGVAKAADDLSKVTLSVNKTQTTLESGIQQILLDQNRRIGALEDRSARTNDLFNDVRSELAGLKAEINAIRRSAAPVR